MSWSKEQGTTPLTPLDVVTRARKNPCIRTWNLQKSLRVAEQLLSLEDKSILPDIEDIINGAVREVKEIIQNSSFDDMEDLMGVENGMSLKLQSYDREGVEDILQQIASMQESVSSLKARSTPRRVKVVSDSERGTRLKESNKENMVENAHAPRVSLTFPQLPAYKEKSSHDELEASPQRTETRGGEGLPWRGGEADRDWLSQRLARTLLSQLIPEVRNKCWWERDGDSCCRRGERTCTLR